MSGALPYFSLNNYFRSKYNTRVQKIIITQNFKCPHSGCAYCYKGSMPPGYSVDTPLEEQIEAGIKKGRKRYGEKTRFMAYFQSFTATNAPVDELKKSYDIAASYPEITGIDVGTRPDCIDAEKLALLDSYVKDEFEVWVEYGLQSANDETLKRINRGHSAADWEKAVCEAKKTSVKPVAHIIIGLPGENENDYMKTARTAVKAGLFGLKIHPLYIMEGTDMAELYKRNKFSLLGLCEYVRVLCDILERIPKDVVIMRFTAEGWEDKLIAPKYCAPAYKNKIRQMLLEEFERRGTRQGSRIKFKT